MNKISTSLSLISTEALYFSLSALLISGVVCKVQAITHTILCRKYLTADSSLKKRIIVDLTTYFAGLCSGILSGRILNLGKFTSFQISMITLALIFFSNGAVTKFFERAATFKNLLPFLSLLLLARSIKRGKKNPRPDPTTVKSFRTQKSIKKTMNFSNKIDENIDSTSYKSAELTPDEIGEKVEALKEAKEEGLKLKEQFKQDSKEWDLANQTITELETLIEKLQEENQELVVENQKIEELLQQIEQLKQDNQEALNKNMTQIGKLKHKNEKSKTEIQNLQSKLQLKSQKIKDLKQENQRVQKQFQDSEDKIEELEKEIKTMKKDHMIKLTNIVMSCSKRIDEIKTEFEKVIKQQQKEAKKSNQKASSGYDAAAFLLTLLQKVQGIQSGMLQ